MTAKNIKKKSQANDQYITPDWCIDQALEIVVPHVMGSLVAPTLILDAGCGDGAFGRMIRSAWQHACIHGFDIDKKLVNKAAPSYDVCEPWNIYRTNPTLWERIQAMTGETKEEARRRAQLLREYLIEQDPDRDAQAWVWHLQKDGLIRKNKTAYDLSIGNPPFTFAADFIERELLLANVVVKILRHGFMSSEERAAWWGRHKPHSVWNIPHRVPFTVDGKADTADYCWIVWKRNYEGATTLHWLPTIPKSIRRPKAA